MPSVDPANVRLGEEQSTPGTRLRIIVVTWFYENQTGFLDFSYRINALAERHDVEVIARADIESSDIRLDRARFKKVATSSANWKQLVVYWLRVRRHLMQTLPDRVVLLGSQLAAIAFLYRRSPTLTYWNEHPSHFSGASEGSCLTRPLKRLVLQATYAGARSATCVMPIGPAHAADLRAHRVRNSRLEQLDMGVSVAFSTVSSQVRPFERPGAPLTLIYAGAVAPERGRDVMLDALAELTQGGANVHLRLVGAAPDQIAYCREKADHMRIGDRLELWPRLPGHEIPRLLATSDAGLCLWEDREYYRFNPPTKLFEYLAAGLPVLASNIRTHSAYIEDGRTGFLFEYSAIGLAAAIRRMLSACSDYPRMRTRAACEGIRYLWTSIEPEFLSIVERLRETESGVLLAKG